MLYDFIWLALGTVYQHGASDSGGFNKPFETAQRKSPKGGTKGAHAPGRTRGPGKSCENLSKAGDVKNDTAGL
jgi:hypothetical protein